MKKISFQSYQISIFEEDSKHASEFAKYVDLTAKLLNRPYFQVFKLVEDWELHKIIRRYNQALEKKDGAQKYWWGLRKADKLHD